MTNAFDAFRAVDFNWARDLQSVWAASPFEVSDLHKDIVDEVMDDFVLRTKGQTSNPIGRVILGSAGAGKTHLMGKLRERVWDANGWFVLLDIVGITEFWATAALGFLNSLHQLMPSGRAQYEAVLSRIARKLPLDESARQAIAQWERTPERDQLGAPGLFLALLRHTDPIGTQRHQDIVRALLLLGSEYSDRRNLAYCWLQGLDSDTEERRRLGFLAPPPPYPELVRGMLWIMSLAGPVMIAVDQIDVIVSASNLLAGIDKEEMDEAERKASSIIELLAGGLMDLHDLKRRALTVVSCLESTWPIIKSRAVKSASERFQEVTALQPISDRRLVEQLIRCRLDIAYSEIGFCPPYPSWPFRPEAMDGVTGLLPRRILMFCDEHQRRCRAAKKVIECTSFFEGPTPYVEIVPATELDNKFADCLAETQVQRFLAQESNEDAFCECLQSATDLHVKQLSIPDDIDVRVQGDPDKRKPSIHCRLTFSFRNEGDRELHYCFRAITQTNANAFQARLRAAMTASGIDRALPFRGLVIVRQDAVPSGTKTKQLVDQFDRAGGKFVALAEQDLRVLLALLAMAKLRLDGFETWLRIRKPLFDITLYKAAGLAPPAFLPSGPVPGDGAAKPAGPSGGAQNHAAVAGPPPSTPQAIPKPGADVATSAGPLRSPSPSKPKTQRDVPLGHRFDRETVGAPVALSADLLPRHVAILAGSGSGKTVLLRRIVEEAALLGIPAIVLDTNNDLARLGDQWPSPPEGWTEEDAAKAADYRRDVEVMIWTPGRNAGRPMSLALLPDFAGLGDDEDERDLAIEMARATLAPFIGAKGASAQLKEGVLADALRRFATEGGGDLERLIEALSDLPDGVSAIDGAPKLASAMANQLRAAIATNPLLQSRGTPLDPGLLFGGGISKTRISVINFSGLASDEARQSFVNQLQMSLFTWIKRNPSPTGRLFVLDEAQNFAPSQKTTPCKESTMALAAQARKYGLGMIFATQTPTGIDNKIVSNCTTHFYGRMSSPTTIAATRGLLEAKGGGGGDDIAKLSRGGFYFSTEAVARPIRIRTPICLTWHPANPLTATEVVERARRG